MKWIILIIIGAAVVYWLYRGRRKNRIEHPEVKTVEKKDYYVKPYDSSSPDDDGPRH
ncbi:DUF2304 domain-containing protein [Marinobacter salicampi]|uniref:DUF2304 domain-containing protein n=1 Tax=Marinobacter salicampi TaxID=435907 RepID=UPI00140C0BF5|nr:DUF2304 domain-containing protein [Marinobacter salicampi]